MVYDCRPEHGTPIDRTRLLGVGYLSRGLTKPRIAEGRRHPETGVAYKTTHTDAGSTTEHNTRDDRVDAVARVETIRAVYADGKVVSA